MNKMELRKEMRQRKQLFTENELANISKDITKRLLVHPKMQAANTILLYASLPDEVQTAWLIEQLLQQNKTILLPVILPHNEMKVCYYTENTATSTNVFGITEPQSTEFSPLDSIDLAIVPGMSFTKNGERLGRGKGYYDRFLLLLPHTYKIGLCFSFQIVTQIPTDCHDIKMNEVFF